MTSAVRSIRFLPGGDSLDRQRYKFGEVFYDRENNTLRVYDGENVGGKKLATQDFVTGQISNIDLTGVATETYVDSAISSALTGDSSGGKYVTSSELTWSSILNKPTFFSGSYNDLTNKPSIPSNTSDLVNNSGFITAAQVPAQVQSDWNQTNNTAVDFIKNKPSIPSLTGYATETFVNTAISNLVNGAPAALDTLNELAAAINDDSSFAGSVTTALSLKAPSSGATLSNVVGITFATGATVNEFSTDTLLSGNSNTAVPTEAAVKSYIDSGLSSKVNAQEPTFYGISTFVGATVPFSLGGFVSTDSRQIGSTEGMFWKPDGTKFYTHDGNSNIVVEWTCSIPWSPNSATAGTTIDYTSSLPTFQYTVRNHIYFKPDGTRAYILVNDGSSFTQFKVASLNLSVAWDLASTSVFLTESTVSLLANPTNGFTVHPDGTSIYLSYSGTTYQYSLGTAWDLNTINPSFIGTFPQSAYLPGSNFGGGIAFNNDGSRIYYIDTNGGMFSFNLSTPYVVASGDLNSLTYFNLSNVSNFTYSGGGSVQWRPDGTSMFVCAQDNSFNQYVWRYDIIASPGEINTDTVNIAENLISSGLTTLASTTEVIGTKVFATNIVEHNYSTSAVWYHSSISSGFIADFTNVPLTDNRVIVVTLILAQSSSAYLPTGVRINGSGQTINWINGLSPSGNANKVDIVSFTFIRTSGSWTVLGSVNTYG